MGAGVVASSWNGSWGGSWGDSWGEVTVDPNAMVGSGTFGFTAAGTLTGVAVSTAPPLFANLFRPIRGASTHVVSARCTTRWALLAPDPVVRIVIAAQSAFTQGRASARGAVASPYTGMAAPRVSARSMHRSRVHSPHAGSSTSFVSGRAYGAGEPVAPGCGCSTPQTMGYGRSHGFVNFPRTVRNPTYEQLVALL